jgi:hypothetical protein
MRRRKVDSKIEQKILTALIMSKEFLGQAVQILDLTLIEAEHFRTVAAWCVDYYHAYNKAPEEGIETIYHGWVEAQEEATEEMDAIHDFLEALSEDYEGAESQNIPHLLDQLAEFMRRKKLQAARDTLDYALHNGDTTAAEQAILEYRGVSTEETAGVAPLNDPEAWERTYAESQKPLFEFPGDAGRFLNPALTRDSLIGIQGPEKRGKTWWCLEFVIRALRARRRVAFFQVGDLSEAQILRRLAVRLVNRPLNRTMCGQIRIPRDIMPPEDAEDELDVEYRVRDYPRPITKNATLEAIKKFSKANGMSNQGPPFLKVGIFSNSSINVRGLDGVLEKWEAFDGFVPDVIVIDYADILAAEDPKKQARDQVNDTWKALRRLSQDRHALVIAPTQADAGSYDIETQSMKNFSEDKRKLAHVTGMLGLNQTSQEKTAQVMRLNWIVLRESPFNSSDCLWVGQSIELGRAYTCGTLYNPHAPKDEEDDD